MTQDANIFPPRDMSEAIERTFENFLVENILDPSNVTLNGYMARSHLARVASLYSRFKPLLTDYLISGDATFIPKAVGERAFGIKKTGTEKTLVDYTPHDCAHVTLCDTGLTFRLDFSSTMKSNFDRLAKALADEIDKDILFAFQASADEISTLPLNGSYGYFITKGGFVDIMPTWDIDVDGASLYVVAHYAPIVFPVDFRPQSL